MKYYLLNKEEIKKDIFTNPILVKTKSMVKIKKYNALKKKLETLYKAIAKELKASNAMCYSTESVIEQFLKGENLTEISNKEYNTLYGLPLYDSQEQRISLCNKTEVLKGKLWGKEIK